MVDVENLLTLSENFTKEMSCSKRPRKPTKNNVLCIVSIEPLSAEINKEKATEGSVTKVKFTGKASFPVRIVKISGNFLLVGNDIVLCLSTQFTSVALYKLLPKLAKNICLTLHHNA